MRLVFAGTPEVAVPALVALHSSAHDVVAVVTRPDAPAGRGRTNTASAVSQKAQELGIQVLQPRRVGESSFLNELRRLEPDCCPVVAFGGLIPAEGLRIPRRGWINLHFSLLPSWRGAAPVQHAVLRGEQITGATTFLLDEGLDTGPTFGTVTEEIRPTDTSGALLERLSVSGAELLLRTIDGIAAGTLGAVPQQSDDVSVAPKLTVDDARVDWGVPALQIDRLVRACTPAPGAWTTFRKERLKLCPLTLAPSDVPLAPGEIVTTKSEVVVGTGGGAVRLGEVQPQGKRLMDAADWARGVRVAADERLE